MAPRFDKVVAARTRTAELIKDTPELLDAYVAGGGLASDLDTIAARGREAEAANQGQSLAGSAAEGAVLDVQQAFVGLQREYKAVMAVVTAVRDDLEEHGAPTDLIVKVEGILADETPVHIRTVKLADGTSSKKARKNRSQEAVRAEIKKDAAALRGEPALTEPLAARKVDAPRLEKLEQAADALSGKLAERVAKKGAGKAQTEAEAVAARAQARRWSASLRILASLDDERVAALVRDARKRK